MAKMMRQYREMKAKGNHFIMAWFKILRRKWFGYPLLLNKGWDLTPYKDMRDSRKRQLADNRKSCVMRQLRRVGYDGPWDIKVKNGRWRVGETWNSEGHDVSELLK